MQQHPHQSAAAAAAERGRARPKSASPAPAPISCQIKTEAVAAAEGHGGFDQGQRGVQSHLRFLRGIQAAFQRVGGVQIELKGAQEGKQGDEAV